MNSNKIKNRKNMFLKSWKLKRRKKNFFGHVTRHACLHNLSLTWRNATHSIFSLCFPIFEYIDNSCNYRIFEFLGFGFQIPIYPFQKFRSIWCSLLIEKGSVTCMYRDISFYVFMFFIFIFQLFLSNQTHSWSNFLEISITEIGIFFFELVNIFLNFWVLSIEIHDGICLEAEKSNWES